MSFTVLSFNGVRSRMAEKAAVLVVIVPWTNSSIDYSLRHASGGFACNLCSAGQLASGKGEAERRRDATNSSLC